MPTTYDPIASTVLTAATAVVTFEVPQTYTDLVLVAKTRSNYNSTVDGIRIRFNNNSSAVYNITRLTVSSTLTKASDRAGSQTSAVVRMAGNNVSVDTAVVYQIMSYTSTTVRKPLLITSAEHLSLLTKATALWNSTAAITSITLSPENGTAFNAGNTFALYGIKAA
jgi:hypothetical protein